MTNARLHDGRVLKFADGMHPMVIQQAVKSQLALEAEEKRQKDAQEKQKQLAEAHKQQQAAAEEQRRTTVDAQAKMAKEQHQKNREDKSDRNHEELRASSQQHLDALQIIAIGLKSILDKIPDTVKIYEEVKNLSKDIKGLEKAINKASDRQAQIALSPVNAVRDQKGKITGRVVEYKE